MRAKTEIDERVEFLKRVQLFADCSKAELRQIAEKAHEVRVASGSVIVEEGSAGDKFFVLAEGLAHVHIHDHKVASIAAGSFFGEMAIIEKGPRSATVTAELPSRLLVIDEKDFDMIRAMPTVSEKLMKAMSNRLRQANRAE